MTDHLRLLAAVGLLAFAAAGAPFARAAEGEEPPYPHGDFAEDCTQCHQSDRWVPATPGPNFKHAAAFPLTGAHRTLQPLDRGYLPLVRIDGQHQAGVHRFAV